MSGRWQVPGSWWWVAVWQVVGISWQVTGVFFYQLFWAQACPEGMCMNGTQVPCEVPSLPYPTTRKGWPHYLVYDPYRIVMWVLLHATKANQ